MTNDNKYKWLGRWFIKAIDKDNNKVIHKEEIKNQIMNVALDEIFKPLYGESADIEVKYLAVGTSSVSVATTQTTLESEAFRTAYTTRTTASDQELTTNYIIFDSEAQIQIEEIGVFGGSSATTVSDTGTMISRILWSYDKTPSNIELQFQRTDKIQRA